MLWCLCGRSREERKFRLAANVATGTVIDRVRRTELAGKRKPLLIYVYGNDGVTAGDLCCHKGR
jgi:hypothetical protein